MPAEATECLCAWVTINDEFDAYALIDTGSTTTTISPAVVDLAKAERIQLKNPATLQLGCVGSRSKINFGTYPRVSIGPLMDEKIYADVVNIDRYDMIIGTPFLHQYGCVIDFENHTFSIRGQAVPLLVGGGERDPKHQKTGLTHNQREQLIRGWVDRHRTLMSGVPLVLPPLRVINHQIPLVDPNKRYHYHLPRCPDTFKSVLRDKLRQYEEAGWWIPNVTDQAAPMLCLPK
ncbi:hypothetical protein K488DRAFT_59835, partial [Vararia minispora EC-137]